jgi:DNA-directed RNA polymerase specialized sigma24 family protein
MNPWDAGRRTLEDQLAAWVMEHSADVCSQLVTRTSPDYQAFLERAWKCWRYYWQNEIKRRGGRAVDGWKVADRFLRDRGGEGPLFRDVVQAEAISQGDNDALEQFRLDHEPRLLNRRWGDLAAFVPDAWAYVFSRLPEREDEPSRLRNYFGIGGLYAYVARILQREAGQLALRKHNQDSPLEEQTRAGRGGGEAPARRAQQADCERLLAGTLRCALNRLADEEQQLLYWRFPKKLKLDTIGAMLGISKGRVGHRLADARDHLGRALQTVVDERRLDNSAVEDCTELLFRELRLSALPRTLLELLKELQGGEESS